MQQRSFSFLFLPAAEGREVKFYFRLKSNGFYGIIDMSN